MIKLTGRPRGSGKASPIQKLAIDNIISGKYKSKYRAAKAAGYSDSYAKKAFMVLQSVGARKYVKTFNEKSLALYKQNLKSKLQDVYLAGLEATKLFGKDAIEHPDYQSRLSYAERISQMLGLLEGKQDDAGKKIFNFFMFDNKQRSKFNDSFKEFVRRQSQV